MLVLSRHCGDQIMIGKNGEVVVTVVEIRGDKVRLGVDAPQDVPVHRREVYEAIQRELGRNESLAAPTRTPDKPKPEPQEPKSLKQRVDEARVKRKEGNE